MCVDWRRAIRADSIQPWLGGGQENWEKFQFAALISDIIIITFFFINSPEI